MRIDVKKFVFWGLDKERNAFFKKAQELGVIHFISKEENSKNFPPEMQETLEAIKVLRTLPVTQQEELDDFHLAQGITKNILRLQNALHTLHEKLHALDLEITQVSPFGDYSADDLKWIEKEAHRTIQFFCGPEGYAEKSPVNDHLIHVATESGLDYFIGIHETPMRYEKLIELKPEASLDVLKKASEDTAKEIKALTSELKPYAKYSHFLHHVLTHQLNAHHLTFATKSADLFMEDHLFVATAWVPENRIEDVQKLASSQRIQCDEVAIEESDQVPTYLENQGASKIGEDLVHVYDTPSNTDKDPSLFVLFFFALFFSMILGDAGYGLVLFLTVLYLQQKHKTWTKLSRRILNLSLILCSFTMLWGVLTTSFFGVTFAPDSQFRKFSLMTRLVEDKTAYHFSHDDEIAQEWIKKYPELNGLKDPKTILSKAVSRCEESNRTCYEMMNKFSDNILMELALFVGALHIIVSFVRYLDRNIAGLGWIAFIIGAYLYLPGYLEAASLVNFTFGLSPEIAAIEGKWLMILGLSFALIVNVIKHKWLGLLEGMTVIQIFADVMSYLRLYALGLAGSLVTATMMDLADGLNFVLASLLLILSHGVNMVLGVMGGVIHGLRLNFLEWYHWSFEGGGKNFNPLKKVEIET